MQMDYLIINLISMQNLIKKVEIKIKMNLNIKKKKFKKIGKNLLDLKIFSVIKVLKLFIMIFTKSIIIIIIKIIIPFQKNKIK